MKQMVVRFVCCMLCLVSMAVASASPTVEESRDRVLGAVSCMASYDDRNARIAESYLKQDGWTIDRYAKVQDKVSADFLIAEKTVDGVEHFLVAVAGTQDMKDVRLDLKMKQVPYGGDSLESFREVAMQPIAKDDDSQMRVHQGFNKFVDVLLTIEVKTPSGAMRPLIDVLRENERSTVYLTGHSLGGAAVTILGARMEDLGIRPSQLRILTFGAPAVGNEPFANAYSTLPLERITMKGDPIVVALQAVAGGYRQFGTETKLVEREKSLGISTGNHAITTYFDVIMKDYYDAVGWQEGGVPYATYERESTNGGKKVYVLPMENRLDARFSKELPYMYMAMADVATMFADGVVLTDTADGWQERAAEAGCQYAILSSVSNHPLKESYDTHYIVYSQTIYDIREHRIVGVVSYSTDNRRMTTFESFLRSLFDAYSEQKDLLK